MKQLIVCSASDAHRLQNAVRRITAETTIMLSPGEADPAVIGGLATGTVTLWHYGHDSAESRLKIYSDLKDLERVYFVAASAVTGSCALRAMVLALAPKLLEAECWKMTLEPVKIPRAFAFLRNLPEGLPFNISRIEALLRRVQAAFAA